MLRRKFGRALLTIATGLLACLVGRADSALVTAHAVPGFDDNLTAIYPDQLAALALASDYLFNGTGNSLIRAGWGSFPLDSEPLAEAVYALRYNLSGAWVTSFSNLTLPVGAYDRLTDASANADLGDLIAALPPESGAPREDRITSFNDWNAPPIEYWDLLREPLASPEMRNWVAEIPPSFEIARNWAAVSLTGDH